MDSGHDLAISPSTGRVALVNLGCRVNRAELDVIARELIDAGCMLVSQREAQVVVVNTCAVTGEAQAKTRKAVRHALHLPQAPTVVATGCVANLFADELCALGLRVIVERSKAEVAGRVLDVLASVGLGERTPCLAAGLSLVGERTRPGIKIQDGCDLRCSYCIVWKARGASRSVPADDVVASVRAVVATGAREVVLTGINLGCWNEGDRRLPQLLERLLDQTKVGRLRLSSIEPPDVTPELVDVMAAHPTRIAPFLHVCLQSGCERTLREMGRIYTAAEFSEAVDMVRARIPRISLGTDLIVGFPGETDGDFAESYAFCERMGFSKMHVFRYSRRPGTSAAERGDQLDPHLIIRRSDEMLSLAARLRSEQARLLVGSDDQVVVQDVGRGVTGGLFDAQVDDGLSIGSLVDVRVRSCGEDGVLDCRSV